MYPLFDLVAPPREPLETGNPKTWEQAEARLGSALPSDYKAFIDRYGSGSFDDFILVYNLFACNEYHNLFYALDTLHQSSRQTRLKGDPAWSVVHPFDLFPAPEGLLPWGCTTHMEDIFFWQVKGKPETWETIFYHLRTGEYEVWKHPLTVFLYQLFTRKIESVLLAEDYPPFGGTVTFISA